MNFDSNNQIFIAQCFLCKEEESLRHVIARSRRRRGNLNKINSFRDCFASLAMTLPNSHGLNIYNPSITVIATSCVIEAL